MIPYPTMRRRCTQGIKNKVHVENGHVENGQCTEGNMPSDMHSCDAIQTSVACNETASSKSESDSGMLADQKVVVVSQPSSNEWTALHISCAALVNHVERQQHHAVNAMPPTNPYGLEYFDKSGVNVLSRVESFEEECEDGYCMGCACNGPNACQ